MPAPDMARRRAQMDQSSSPCVRAVSVPPQTLGAGEAAASEENQGEGKTAGQWAGAITGGAHITVGSLAKSLGTYCYYPFHRRKAEAEEVV